MSRAKYKANYRTNYRTKNGPQTRRGGVLVLIVLSLAALLGVAALAVDIGLAQAARQRAQAVADAAALAGAGAPDAPAQAAAAVASANGPDFQGLTVSTAPDGTVTAGGYVDAPLAFAPAVGYAPRGRGGDSDTLSVPATAIARMPPACGLPRGMPVAPFGLIGDDPAATDAVTRTVTALLNGSKTLPPGAYQPASAQMILKLNVWDSGGTLAVRGNFAPLLLSGAGAAYANTISQTTDQPLAAGLALPTPPLASDNADLTRQYLAARLAPSNTQFTHLAATYDAWYGGRREQTDGHFLLLPIVSQGVRDKQGSETVLAFAAFWVDQPYPRGSAGTAVALGRFLGVSLPSASGGACGPAGTRAPPRLVP